MSATKPLATRSVADREEPSRAEKERELDGLLRSGVVREHTYLHSLLGYLGRKSVEDEAEPLKEYTIGVEALGKPEDYDPRLDPTVRVDIGKLRARLREYYQGPGSTRLVHAEIPKGHYHLIFARAPRMAPLLSLPARLLRRPAATAALGFLAATAVLGSLHALAPAGRELSAELKAFWNPFVASPIPTLVVYGTPLFLKGDRWYFRDPHVNRTEDGERAEDVAKVVSVLKPTARRWVVNFTGLGEAEALFMITRLLASQGAALSVQRSSSLSWEDMKGKHVILLGSHKFNPRIPELPVSPKFQVASRPSRVVNLEPAPGEPADYRTVTTAPNGEIVEEYALVSIYGGFTADTHLMVLSCSSSEGTGAAAEYVTRPDTMRELFEKMRVDPAKAHLPRAFQVVIKAKMKDGIPVQLSHVTHHVLAP
jgi:hypothetical protein